MPSMANKIDFVVLWVDGDDAKWLEQKDSYSPKREGLNVNKSRFRDWGIFNYWFRAVENYAPWVNNVFLVTWGHVPSWLNLNHPKLKVVRHEDYIPERFLPTFNSNTIELNLHRIPELSETFVLFNDDMFLLKETRKEDFFIAGLPTDEMVANIIIPHKNGYIITHTNVNNTSIINKRFNKREVVASKPNLYFNWHYGINNIRSLVTLPLGQFTGFRNPHIPVSHLKSTFNEVWKLESEALERTCENRFRGYEDVNHWLFRYWNLCSGAFVPRSSSIGAYYDLSRQVKQACDCVLGQRHKMVCINDDSPNMPYETIRKALTESFEAILPNKSSFEK